MKELLLQSDLQKFALTSENIFELNARTLVVKKWDWDYAQAHAFQRHALELVQNSNNLRILICTSHPEVLTNGRGLQRAKKGEDLGLVDFDPTKYQTLPFPLFQIERGGGLTFHHPGQFIFYPIVKLNPKTLSLSNMMDQIFDFAIEVLSSWGMTQLTHEHKLLGLWWENRKLASMGIAIEKLTTFHGMALNIKYNSHMKEALRALNPCGLTAETYISVEEMVTLPENPLETFASAFLEKVKHEWQ